MAATNSGTQQAIPVPCPVSSFFVWATAWQQQPAPQILFIHAFTARPCPQRPCWNVIRISWHQVQTIIKHLSITKAYKSTKRYEITQQRKSTRGPGGQGRRGKQLKTCLIKEEMCFGCFWSFFRYDFCFYAAYVILLARPALCQTRILCYTSSAHMSNSFQKSSSTSSLNAQE